MSKNNYCVTILFQAKVCLSISVVCSMCGSEPERSQLLSAVLRRMQESVQCGTSAVLQNVEALCDDLCLAPKIRLQAIELLQVRKYFCF
jgi:hypothetical protein